MGVIEMFAAVPLIVSVHSPEVVASLTLTVSVELLPLVDAGLKLAVAPAGKPLTDKATAPVKFTRVKLI
jgi:hypothetical protein